MHVTVHQGDDARETLTRILSNLIAARQEKEVGVTIDTKAIAAEPEPTAPAQPMWKPKPMCSASIESPNHLQQ
jgi:hypothetical protein